VIPKYFFLRSASDRFIGFYHLHIIAWGEAGVIPAGELLYPGVYCLSEAEDIDDFKV
jgi:hypothetical protein